MMHIDLHNTLSLIAATIFADTHVYASEIDVFIKSALKLKFARRLEAELSEEKLSAWFEMNKTAISDKLSTPYFKDWLYDLLEQLKAIPEKESILDAMQKVSYADGKVHISERTLMTLARQHWKL